MKDRKSFLSGFLSGMVPSIYEPTTFPSLEGSDLSRMRGDVERVGKDFATVIHRENGKKTHTPKPQAK